MKKFNVEKYNGDPSTLRYRNGEKVLDIFNNKFGLECEKVVSVRSDSALVSHYPCGKISSSNHKYGYDLFFKSNKQYRVIKVLDKPSVYDYIIKGTFSSKKMAKLWIKEYTNLDDTFKIISVKDL